jgi:hypothetical protein
VSLDSVQSSSQFEIERRLVDELTAEGGMRAAPPPELLTKFTRNAATLNSSALLLLLQTKMNGSSATAQLVHF